MPRPSADRLIRSEVILSEGLITAPLAAFADSVDTALLLSIAFCIITVCSVMLSALIPKGMPFSLRILFYSVIGAFVYIPAALAVTVLFPDISTGIYLPLLASSLLITAERDRLFRQKGAFGQLIGTVCSAVLVIIPFGCIRELLGAGTLHGTVLLAHPPLPVLQNAAAGLVLLACLCIGAEALRSSRKEVTHADSR